MSAPDRLPARRRGRWPALRSDRAGRPRTVGERLGDGGGSRRWVRVELWSAGLRFQHWASVALIVVLSATGWYIMDPFFGPQPGDPGHTGFLMGWIRFAHILAGFLWLGLGLARFILLFIARGRQTRWYGLWPFHSVRDVKLMGRTIIGYLFLRDHPHYIAHNALQQLSYTAIYGICLIQVLTGLALYGLADQSNWLLVVLSYPVHWVGVPVVRLIHTLLMFVLWAFVVIHVYLVVRAEVVEGHGGLSAMIGGGMWVREGTVPVDGDYVDSLDHAQPRGGGDADSR